MSSRARAKRAIPGRAEPASTPASPKQARWSTGVPVRACRSWQATGRASGSDRIQASRLDDAESSGELRSHELLLDGRYSLGPRRLTTAAGAFLRVSDLETPYLIVHGDLRAGLRFDVESWLIRRVRFKASYEIADPS